MNINLIEFFAAAKVTRLRGAPLIEGENSTEYRRGRENTKRKEIFEHKGKYSKLRLGIGVGENASKCTTKSTMNINAFLRR